MRPRPRTVVWCSYQYVCHKPGTSRTKMLVIRFHPNFYWLSTLVSMKASQTFMFRQLLFWTVSYLKKGVGVVLAFILWNQIITITANTTGSFCMESNQYYIPTFPYEACPNGTKSIERFKFMPNSKGQWRLGGTVYKSVQVCEYNHSSLIAYNKAQFWWISPHL